MDRRHFQSEERVLLVYLALAHSVKIQEPIYKRVIEKSNCIQMLVTNKDLKTLTWKLVGDLEAITLKRESLCNGHTSSSILMGVTWSRIKFN